VIDEQATYVVSGVEVAIHRHHAPRGLSFHLFAPFFCSYRRRFTWHEFYAGLIEIIYRHSQELG
jgi:hypothetical protein